MKVVYVFQSEKSYLILENMIIPQLEIGEHGVEVAGMFFFHDCVYFFIPEHPIGEKLTRIASKHGFFLICCDYCCEERGIANRLYPGVEIACFPDLYKKVKQAGVQQVITL